MKTNSRKEGARTRVCFQNRSALSAPEARQPVAHGATVGLAVKINQAPAGAAEKPALKRFFRPCRGADGLGLATLSVAVPQRQMDFENTPWEFRRQRHGDPVNGVN